MSNPALDQPTSGEPGQLDYFSEERSYYAAVAYARVQAHAEVRYRLASLVEVAERLARELEGEHGRLAEELRDHLCGLIWSAE